MLSVTLSKSITAPMAIGEPRTVASAGVKKSAASNAAAAVTVKLKVRISLPPWKQTVLSLLTARLAERSYVWLIHSTDFCRSPLPTSADASGDSKAIEGLRARALRQVYPRFGLCRLRISMRAVLGAYRRHVYFADPVVDF